MNAGRGRGGGARRAGGRRSRIAGPAKSRFPWTELAVRFLESCDSIITLDAKASSPGEPAFKDYLVMGRLRGKNRVLLLRWMEGRALVGRGLVEDCAAIRSSRKAHLCIVCSRGSFEKDAVYSASVNKVNLIRAMPRGKGIRFVQDFAVLAKFLAVDNWALRLYRLRDDKSGHVFDGNSPDLSHDGSLVSNWLCGESIKLLQGCETSGLFEAKYVLNSPQAFLYSRRRVIAERLEAWIFCRVKYAYQVDSKELEGAKANPSGAAMTRGMREYPADSWNGLDFNPENPPDPSHLGMVFLDPVPWSNGVGSSKLNKHVRSRSVRFVP